MKKPVIIIGIGEIGGVFARGFLRCGYPVYPVTRDSSMADAAARTPDPEMVLVAVAEKDLHNTLADLPASWHDRFALLQNELLPADWQKHGYASPTVISVWFEKKPGQDAKPIIASPAFGPHAALLVSALGSIGIPATVLGSETELLFELVRKNVYILTTNIAGLQTGGTVGELWSQHRTLAEEIATEVIGLQEKLSGQPLDQTALISGMVEAFEGDPEHKCTGRSAQGRLQRALQLADSFQGTTPRLRAIEALAGV